MPMIPAVTPDGEKISQLIKGRGYKSVRAFAITRKRPKTLMNVVYNEQRASVEYMKRLARTLGTTIEEITKAEAADAGSEPPSEAGAIAFLGEAPLAS